MVVSLDMWPIPRVEEDPKAAYNLDEVAGHIGMRGSKIHLTHVFPLFFHLLPFPDKG